MAQITYTIPDNKLAEFKTGFLKHRPVPTDSMGNPTMSESAWIKEWGKQQFINAYRNGKHSLATQAAEIEGDIIE